MKKKIKIFLIFFITLTSNMPFSNELDPYIQPEYQSLKSNSKLKYAKTKKTYWTNFHLIYQYIFFLFHHNIL